jgi:hypothetical protein
MEQSAEQRAHRCSRMGNGFPVTIHSEQIAAVCRAASARVSGQDGMGFKQFDP